MFQPASLTRTSWLVGCCLPQSIYKITLPFIKFKLLRFYGPNCNFQWISTTWAQCRRCTMIILTVMLFSTYPTVLKKFMDEEVFRPTSNNFFWKFNPKILKTSRRLLECGWLIAPTTWKICKSIKITSEIYCQSKKHI